MIVGGVFMALVTFKVNMLLSVSDYMFPCTCPITLESEQTKSCEQGRHPQKKNGTNESMTNM